MNTMGYPTTKCIKCGKKCICIPYKVAGPKYNVDDLCDVCWRIFSCAGDVFNLWGTLANDFDNDELANKVVEDWIAGLSTHKG